ncbi:MAG: hypothetical protein VX278_02750 [Myxococcota bacterium]|nr:hypothetical protein [Myxococcota bacterium]
MGSPTGIAAINAALRTGYSTQQLYLNWNTQSDQIRLVTDQTWVFYEFPSDENLTFPLYWGMRGWANLNQVSTGLGLEGISQEMGIGLPLGITMYHKKAAIDLYFEFAPVLQLLPSTLFSFQSGVGFRMYPKLPTLRKRK